MLTALLAILKAGLIIITLAIWVFVAIYAVFKKVEWGMLLTIALIPLPALYYKFFPPIGEYFVEISVLCVLLGLVFQKNKLPNAPSLRIILLFLLLSHVSFWITHIYFSLPMPISRENPILGLWTKYAETILMYFLAISVFKEEQSHKRVIVLMAMVMLLVGVKSATDFTVHILFSYGLRYEGPFKIAGANINHYASFMAYSIAAISGILFFEKDKRLQLLYAGAIFFGVYAILFAYSRGAYLAIFSTLALYAFLYKRSLLILIGVLLLSWNILLPTSVVDRIEMTETSSGQLEHSAGLRLILWNMAIDTFLEHPILGIGFKGFYLKLEKEHIMDIPKDPHNYYLTVLSEQGVVGFALFSVLLLTALRRGWRLFKMGVSPFYRGLGLGFLGATLSMMVSNLFGNRWAYPVPYSYFWILWGLVDCGIMNSKSEAIARENNASSQGGEVHHGQASF